MPPSFTEILKELQLSVAGAFPSLQDEFRPGLELEELEQLERELAPYKLPESLRALFLWHNGADSPLAIFPPYEFLSLAEAIWEYRLQREIDPGSEGWNPLWFPLFSFDGDYCIVILSEEPKQTSEVYESIRGDTELILKYPSVESILKTAVECFSSGVYSYEDEYLYYDEDLLKQVRAKLVNLNDSGSYESIAFYSKSFTQNWPQAWRDGIGRTPEDYICKGASSSIAEYLAAPSPVTIQGRIVELMGTSSETIFEVQDTSGKMTVLCPRSTTGSREIQCSRTYEFSIRPCDPMPSEFALKRRTHCSAFVEHVILIK